MSTFNTSSLITEKLYEFSGKLLKCVAYGWSDLDIVINKFFRFGSKNYWEDEFENSSFDYKNLASKKSWNNFIKQVNDKNIKTI